MSSYPIWDLPTRAFHWLLTLAVAVSWASHEFDYFTVHKWSGYTVLVLVGFRLTWGFVGSAHSRFSDFISKPGTVARYLKGQLEDAPGHNPLGGWSVVVMLLLLLGQALSGLFNSDGLMYDGPLYHALDSSWTDKLGELHESLFWVLLGFILLHVGSVLFYQFGRRKNLLGAMWHGGQGGRAEPASPWRALLLVALCAAALATVVYFAPAPSLPW